MQPLKTAKRVTARPHAGHSLTFRFRAGVAIFAFAVTAFASPQLKGQQFDARRRPENSGPEKTSSRLAPALNQLIRLQTRTEPSANADPPEANSGRPRTSSRAEWSSAQPSSTVEPSNSHSDRAGGSRDPQIRPASYQLSPVPTADAGLPAVDVTEVDSPLPSVKQSTPASSVPVFLDLTAERPAGAFPGSTDSANEQSAGLATEASPVQVLMRAAAWIVIALCLFSLAALGVRRWQRQKGLLPTSNNRSQILETLSLGPGRSVSLIEMAGYRALVAFDAGGIKQLILAPSTFDDEYREAEKEISAIPKPEIIS